MAGETDAYGSGVGALERQGAVSEIEGGREGGGGVV